MSTMTAAQSARAAIILDRTFTTDTFSMSWREAIDTGAIAYGRIRTFSSGKRSYGVILASDVEAGVERGGAEYASYYDAPKTVVDACATVIHV